MTKRRLVEIETTGSVFFDLFERGKAERLSIQTGLALALEREIKARRLTQAAAARALGIAQPRVTICCADAWSASALMRSSSISVASASRCGSKPPARSGRAGLPDMKGGALEWPSALGRDQEGIRPRTRA